MANEILRLSVGLNRKKDCLKFPRPGPRLKILYRDGDGVLQRVKFERSEIAYQSHPVYNALFPVTDVDFEVSVSNSQMTDRGVKMTLTMGLGAYKKCFNFQPGKSYLIDSLEEHGPKLHFIHLPDSPSQEETPKDGQSFILPGQIQINMEYGHQLSAREEICHRLQNQLDRDKYFQETEEALANLTCQDNKQIDPCPLKSPTRSGQTSHVKEMDLTQKESFSSCAKCSPKWVLGNDAEKTLESVMSREGGICFGGRSDKTWRKSGYKIEIDPLIVIEPFVVKMRLLD